MQTRRAIEMTFGMSLLLGPLVYALTLEYATSPETSPECPADPVAATSDDGARGEPDPTPESVTSEPAVDDAPPSAEPSRPDDLAEFLFVTDAGIVLSQAAERGWGQGWLFEPRGTVSYRAAKRADAAAIPSELWARAGRRYDLYGPDGKLCTARLGELRVVAQYDGYGIAGLLGDEWFDEDPETAKRADIRRALWQRDDLWLVAQIAADGPCEGALWARDAELPAPTILRETSADNPASAARRAELLASEELAEIERSYRDSYTELAAEDPETAGYYDTWDELARKHGAETWSWVDGHGRARVVGLEFGLPPEGCGEWLSSWVASLELVHEGHDGALQFDPIAYLPIDQPHRPEAIFDADGDGQLERLYHSEDGWHLVSASMAADALLEYDWYCPC